MRPIGRSIRSRSSDMGPDMADLQQMSRILYHHNWTNVEDWAHNVDQLADLSDDEIGQLQQGSGELRCSSVNTTLAVSSGAESPSLIARTRQSLLDLCETLRLGLRRTC